MSMIGLAAIPGIAVDPMWWMPPSSHGGEDALQQCTFGLEPARPLRVVRDDDDPFVDR
jgi:hypothetical protein